ncbi:helix-turn-helix domain-containing protein [Haliscomenobacter hydrossis]|uniref:Transcriptional regulator, AraC family n=1 Tax=Haliscomenobacter hydrossis (strain ATCC 27775 / DSM 1100 / LMG 10767 / O) TaxID=760192 RepID=F4KQI5_HALH1|nr:helix-turn-helix domain-containing protein [Haliscomenobacter hydrossis]AEE49974.1 transcriptional regulator, AraC family [Haliscomenobacter hydrossis DSM 1100]
MELSKSIFFFFSALGAFNGLLLSSYFFFFAKRRTVSHYFLGALLLALSLRVGKSVLFYFDHDLPKIYLQIGLSACFFIGPTLYFFLKSGLNSIKSLPCDWGIHLLVLFSLIALGGIILPYQQYPWVWNRVYVPIIYTEWAIYLVASGILMKDVLKKVFFQRAEAIPYDLWMASIYLINVLIFAAFLWAFWGGLPYISAAITFSFALYVSIFILLNRKKNDDLFPSTSRINSKKLSDEEAILWQNKLEQLMKEKQVFRNPNLKLQDLAQELRLSPHQLSQFLNESLGKNFTQFINEYRIVEACKLLKTDTLLSIEGIGDEVGFNSKSTFFSTFKKIKGLTPAKYRQHIVKI